MAQTKASSAVMAKKDPPKPDARATIQKRIDDLGWSRNRLAEYCRSKRISKSTVYDFLAGNREVTTGTLDAMLDILGLDYAVSGPVNLPPE